MKRTLLLFGVALSLATLTACDAFVSNVDRPKDSTPSELLDSPQDVRFLATGVQTQGANATDFLTFTSALLSDQFRFGKNGDATFPTYAAPDRGLPTRLNTSVGAATNALGEYRRLADDLLEAAERPEEYGDSPPITKQQALYLGNLHGAIARYYYATYIGNGPRQGGGVIDRSEFIPSPAMYDSARVKFNRALSLAPTARDSAIVRSLHARNALYAGTHEYPDFGGNPGGYSNPLQRAAELAAQGLKPGMAGFNARYSVQSANEWWANGGPSRFQIVAMDNLLERDNVAPTGGNTHKDFSEIRSFPQILASNPAEAARIPLQEIPLGGGISEFGQTKYAVESSPIPYISWEEVHLIRAELQLDHGLSTGSKSALELVNEVRANGTLPGSSTPFGLSPLSSIDMETLAQERDRTLFAQGQRLPDQRRLDEVDWHLKDSFQGQTTWQYLPITSQELDNNPNLGDDS